MFLSTINRVRNMTGIQNAGGGQRKLPSILRQSPASSTRYTSMRRLLSNSLQAALHSVSCSMVIVWVGKSWPDVTAALVVQYLKHLQVGKLILDGSPFFPSEIKRSKSDPESSGWEFLYFLKRKARTHLTHISQTMVLDVRSSSNFTTFIIPKNTNGARL